MVDIERIKAAYRDGFNRGSDKAPKFATDYVRELFDPENDGMLKGLAHVIHDTFSPSITATRQVWGLYSSQYRGLELLAYRIGAFEGLRTPTKPRHSPQ